MRVNSARDDCSSTVVSRSRATGKKSRDCRVVNATIVPDEMASGEPSSRKAAVR